MGLGYGYEIVAVHDFCNIYMMLSVAHIVNNICTHGPQHMHTWSTTYAHIVNKICTTKYATTQCHYHKIHTGMSLCSV